MGDKGRLDCITLPSNATNTFIGLMNVEDNLIVLIVLFVLFFAVLRLRVSTLITWLRVGRVSTPNPLSSYLFGVALHVSDYAEDHVEMNTVAIL